MSNPFDEISQKIDTVLTRLDRLEKKQSVPTKILLSDFCRDQQITRPTAYAWSERGLIKMEKIGGRNFIAADSVVVKKYQRREPEA